METGPIFQRVQAVLQWNDFARKYLHPSRLEASITFLNLIDTALTRAPSIDGQYRWLLYNGRIMENVASSAAAAAIHQGDLPLAISLLEQGRALILSQLGRYRTTLEELKDRDPVLATNFAQLSKELDVIVVRLARLEPNESQGVSEDLTSRYVAVLELHFATLWHFKKVDVDVGTYAYPKSGRRLWKRFADSRDSNHSCSIRDFAICNERQRTDRSSSSTSTSSAPTLSSFVASRTPFLYHSLELPLRLLKCSPLN